MKESLKQFIRAGFDSALQNGSIQAYYQPVIRTISGRLCSFEALARWVDPEFGILRPDQFIPVLEQDKRIHLLDSHIIREVCRQLRRSIDSGETPIPVSVNLSRLDFICCDIFSVVDQQVSAFQIPHDFLYIEITESILGEQEGLMHEVVDRFHEAGYQVWMDDFGSGYSSLNMLKDYSFDELKLDMRFLSSLDRRSRRILTSVIHMAKEIDIHTLAEGVETEEQFLYLRDIGCEKVQGYYFGAPMPYAKALEHLREKGVAVELPLHRKYYDDLGRIDFLSSLPLLDQKERKQLVTARQLNSIPLALVEMRRDFFSLLFSNTAFEQNLRGAELLQEDFRNAEPGATLPLTLMPERVVNLLKSTRDKGLGRMLFVSHDEYYELKTRCVARRRGAFCVLMQLNNLSQASQAASTMHLDEGLRQLYTLFDRITLIDLEKDCITPLYVGRTDYLTKGREGIAALAVEFARTQVFREDQGRILQFYDISTLDARLNASGHNAISGCFRCLMSDGQYDWKQFIIMRYRPGILLELIHDARAELAPFRLRETDNADENNCPPEMLWKNLIQSDVVRMFWKDRERRFLGVNRGFLEYYGFGSDQDVVGKTDEDLGWHVHPDLYMNDELRVINEGVTTHNIPGRCISNGENREILANKTPLYNEAGDIVGLLGCFIDRGLLTVNDVRGLETASRDEMTGLLNSRGLSEQIQAFQDEYYLRGTDFMRLHVSIDDISAVNRQYGYDFGDKVITALGDRLRKMFGLTSSVGRINGYEFVILHQIRDRRELSEIRGMIKRVADSIQEVDGMAVTLYLSLGYALYSEFEDLDELTQSAEMRLLVDHDDHAPAGNRQSRSSDFFRLYDNLPISYAVYQVHADRSRKVTDATLFYANHLFERRAGNPLEEMLGRSVRELFPDLDESWYDMARRAALLGETIVDTLYYKETERRYYITGNQIIRPGYCSFTYQELDRDGKPVEPDAL